MNCRRLIRRLGLATVALALSLFSGLGSAASKGVITFHGGRLDRQPH